MCCKKLKLVVDNVNVDPILWLVFRYDGSILEVCSFNGLRRKLLVKFYTKVSYNKFISDVSELYSNSDIVKYF